MAQNNTSNIYSLDVSYPQNAINPLISISASSVTSFISGLLSLRIHTPETSDHSTRVAELAEKIANTLHLHKKTITNIKIAALLHDIGKIGSPNEILSKQTPLTNNEYNIMQKHTITGEKLINNMKLNSKIASYIGSHHEHFDGNGYPKHLSGKNIPFGGRIIAVADAYDAMTFDRPYHKGISDTEAMQKIETDKGKHFDPLVVAAFKKISGQISLSI